jgi:hypothetical protein
VGAAHRIDGLGSGGVRLGSAHTVFLVGLAAALGLSFACGPARTFACRSDAQCDTEGIAGVCMPSGACAQPDERCTSGMRYVVHAPPALSGACARGSARLGRTVARWTFDDSSGDTVTDLSRSGRDGVVSDGGVLIADGVRGRALRVDGVAGRMESASRVFERRSFSGSLWVRSLDTDSNQARLWGNWYDVPEGPGGYFYANWGNGHPFVESHDSTGAFWGAGVRGSDPTLADGQWHQIGFVINRERGESQCYVDGLLNGVQPTASDGLFGDAAVVSPFTVGSMNYNAATSLEGDIDELWIFDAALNEDDMTALARFE